MGNAQLGMGVFFLCLSIVLRNWNRMNLQLPVSRRPGAFQNHKFILFLSMIWQGLLAIGLIMIALVNFLLVLVALGAYFFVFSPLILFFLKRFLGYDKLSLSQRR